MSYPIPVLMYHAVQPERSVISILPQVFSDQMQWLHDHGYQVLSLLKLADLLMHHCDPPEKCIVITFDDGFASLMDHVLPILNRFGFTATVFLVAGYCGKSNNWPGQPAGIPNWPLMTWNSIRDMDLQGTDIGVHTMSHPRLDLLPAAKYPSEILGSKELIEDQLGHAVFSFSYPYGRYNNAIKSIVAGAFRVACGTRLGLVNKQSDIWSLERVEISYIQNKRIFRGLDSNWFLAYLNSRRTLRKVASTVLRREWY